MKPTPGTPAAVAAALDRVRAELDGLLPLPALDPAGYAAAHRTFEAHSDQRTRIAGWLGARFGAFRPDLRSLSVLSVGCGDGSVDVALAAALAVGRPVTYTGVEPNAGAGAAFVARLGGLPGVRPVLRTGPFEDLRFADRYDLVVAVHSMYYVRQLSAALRRALDLRRPDGTLALLHAPLGAVNQLAQVLTPEWGGHPLWYGETLAGALTRLGATPRTTRLPGRLESAPCFDTGSEAGRQLLEFLVQARIERLPAAARGAVLDYLAAIGVDGTTVLPHPVDAFVVRA